MQYVQISELPEQKNPHSVSVRKLHQSEHAQIMHIALKPDQTLIPHITPVDVCFYILEGSPTVTIGEDSEPLPAGTLIESPAGIPHCLANYSDAAARILVIKTPKPTEPTKLLRDE